MSIMEIPEQETDILRLDNRQLCQLLRDQRDKIAEQQKTMAYALAKVSEARENGAGRHFKNISENCRMLAMSLARSPEFEQQIDDAFIDRIEMASLLHDIGKVSISDRILLKPGSLTGEERAVIETHAEIGAKVLQEIADLSRGNQIMEMAVEIAYYHHERWDGTGYPKGLRGTEIPLAARIMAVVDVYDSLVSERCYKPAYSHEESMRIIREESGKMFDPDIVAIVEKVQRQLKR